MATVIQTFQEFASETTNPEFTLAILRLCHGGRGGIIVGSDEQQPPDIVFGEDEDEAG